jgi:hypothetical protein
MHTFEAQFTRSQMVAHVETLLRFYESRSQKLALDLVAGAINAAEFERQMRELIAFVGDDTTAMWSALGRGAAAA